MPLHTNILVELGVSIKLANPHPTPPTPPSPIPRLLSTYVTSFPNELLGGKTLVYDTGTKLISLH